MNKVFGLVNMSNYLNKNIWRSGLLALAASLLIFTVAAPAAYGLSVSVLESPRTVVFNGAEANGQAAPSEVPPWQVQGGWRQFWLSSAHTVVCASPANIAGPLPANGQPIVINCGQTQPGLPTLLRMTEGDFLSAIPSALPPNTPWSSEYHSVSSAEYLPRADGTGDQVTISHGENKNEMQWHNGVQYWYKNALNPKALETPGQPFGYPFGSAQFGNPRTTGSNFSCPGGTMNTDANGHQISGSPHMVYGSWAYAPDDLSSFTGQTSGSWSPGQWAALTGAQYYSNCHEAYNAFITSQIRHANSSNNWGLAGQLTDTEDQGPIIWPQAGYKNANNDKVSWGVRHPSALINGGYMYVYYLDTSGSPDVNHGKIKVARSLVSSKGASGTWQVWNPSSGSMTSGGSWVAATPFANKAQFLNNKELYYKTPGPASDGIIQGSTRFDSVASQNAQRGYLRFSVAKVNGTNKFVAVSVKCTTTSKNCENTGTADCGLQTYIHQSNDAIHWTQGTPVPGFNACNDSNATKLFYPILLNAAGTSNENVDANGFYILGSRHRAKVSISGL